MELIPQEKLDWIWISKAMGDQGNFLHCPASLAEHCFDVLHLLWDKAISWSKALTDVPYSFDCKDHTLRSPRVLSAFNQFETTCACLGAHTITVSYWFNCSAPLGTLVEVWDPFRHETQSCKKVQSCVCDEVACPACEGINQDVALPGLLVAE